MRELLTTRVVLLLLFYLGWPLAAQADIAVIVHPDNPQRSMTQREVSDLYLGRSRHFSSNAQPVPLPASIYEQPADCALREAFFLALNGMGVKQLNAYWARLRYSGEVLPPSALADSRAVLDAVKRNRNGIGYVDAAIVNNSVKVVLLLKE